MVCQSLEVYRLIAKTRHKKMSITFSSLLRGLMAVRQTESGLKALCSNNFKQIVQTEHSRMKNLS